MDMEINRRSLAWGGSGIALQIVTVAAGIPIAKELRLTGEEALTAVIGAWIVGTAMLIAGLCMYAQAKHQSSWWGLMGLLTIVGLLVLAALPDRHAHSTRVRSVTRRIADLPDADSVEFRCMRCGYQLNGITGASCPECGQGFNPDDLTTVKVEGLDPEQPLWSGRWSLICGIFGIVTGLIPFCGPVMPILGISFGHMTLSQINSSRGRIPGRNVALAGLILSYAGLAIALASTSFVLLIR